MPRTFFPALLILLGLTSPALAEDPVYDRVSLSVSASTELDNDKLVAVLGIQHEAADAASASNQVNKDMAWALAQVKPANAVKVQTLGYRSTPVYSKTRLTGWRVSQELRLESRDGALLSDMLGQLQSHMQLQSVGYEVSEAAREEAVKRLTAEAIDKFRQRAQEVAESFGRRDYRIVELHINDSGQAPVLRRSMMAAEGFGDAKVRAPSLEAGSQTLQVNISGSIELTAQ